MKTKNNKFSSILTLLVLLLSTGIILFQSCGMEDLGMQPKGNYISGYAVFVDTLWYHDGGNYAIALYNKVQDPFAYKPVLIKNIDMSSPTPNPAYWRIDNESTGDYFAAIVWVGNNSLLPPTVLGTYGCDTSHSCNTNSVISFPNFSGANYNILCFCDTTRGLN